MITAALILLATVGATAGLAVLVALVALHHHLAHRRDRWQATQATEAAVAERAARLAAGRIDQLTATVAARDREIARRGQEIARRDAALNRAADIVVDLEHQLAAARDTRWALADITGPIVINRLDRTMELPAIGSGRRP